MNGISRNERRYQVLRDYIEPRTLYDKLVSRGKLRGAWCNIPKEQSIAQKIDELCDMVLQQENRCCCGERTMDAGAVELVAPLTVHRSYRPCYQRVNAA